eukprot:PLAT8325.2.p1 GENE.PLAT8325.2~~PLAT8325.2.p1  ORF type:complete len:397 (-),score=99.78 PLAT8325.2:45-1235(-)
MALGGALERRFGARKTALLGCSIFSLAVLLTRWAIVSFPATVLVYGLMFGCGTGITYTPALVLAMRWFPHKRGLLGGIVVAGFGAGASLFDVLQTRFVNADNARPSLAPFDSHPEERYYAKSQLSRLPQLFLLLAAIYYALQLTGIALVRCHPRKAAEKEDRSLLDEGSSAIDSGATAEAAMSLRSTLRTPLFWQLWLCFLVCTVFVTLVASLFKVAALASVKDDQLLAAVGTAAAVCNGGGRVLWGALSDRLQPRTALSALLASMALLSALFPLVLSSVPLYITCAMLLFTALGGVFALFPAIVATLFGQAAVGLVYGLVFTAQLPAGMLSIFGSALLSRALGVAGVFYGLSALTALAAVVTCCTLPNRGPAADIADSMRVESDTAGLQMATLSS